VRYLFDVTTAAHWSGPAVGIVRVERELARRARNYLGQNLEFCLYDRFQNQVVTIDDSLAGRIIDQKVQVDFEPFRFSPIGARMRARIVAARRQYRRKLLSYPKLYTIFQKMRGRSFTHEEILRIQAQGLAGDPQWLPVTEVVPLRELSHRPARLDSETCILSSGLDWEFKNLQELLMLKHSKGFRYCAVVHDLIPIKFPHFVVPALGRTLSTYFSQLLKLADRIMCNSESTRRDWLEYARDRGTQPTPSRVFSLGCDLPSDRIVQSTGTLPPALEGKRFALYVSTIEPRKNHRALYQAWDRCIQLKRVDPTIDRLVFVGHRGWGTGDLLREISANPNTRDTIVMLSGISDADLDVLYRKCLFVLFPSHYEGFGLAVAEALGHGKLCVCSNAGALSEIGGDLVPRLHPKDATGWADAIAHFLTTPAEVEKRNARIRTEFRPVTWDESARLFFQAIQDPAI
jgi:glycosyltransferase involved in cell wall biosynthesis